MKRCLICVIPDTRPDTPFVDGVCSACHNHHARALNEVAFDWQSAENRLLEILDKNVGWAFDCIVPSSGGKDSTWQVMQILNRGYRPLVVTATTCHLTAIGRRNIDNLARYATTIEVTPNRKVRAKLNRAGLALVGDISWPEHVSIFTTPFRIAKAMGINLIVYGENPQRHYGGPPGTEDATDLTARWRSEFGGFLGLRPSDLVGYDGIEARDMTDYILPELEGIRAIFLGQFLPWDSARNIAESAGVGMEQVNPCPACWWHGENLDNAQTGLHDHLMYRKYGYGRGCAQISVDVRRGVITRQTALDWVRVNDGLFPWDYAGVSIHDVLGAIGLVLKDFPERLEKWTDRKLFLPRSEDQMFRPILKEFA